MKIKKNSINPSLSCFQYDHVSYNLYQTYELLMDNYYLRLTNIVVGLNTYALWMTRHAISFEFISEHDYHSLYAMYTYWTRRYLFLMSVLFITGKSLNRQHVT